VIKKPATALLISLLIMFFLANRSGGQIPMEVKQVTFGPKHHIFGYIGHVGNIPWNANNQYILALEFDHQDRMPGTEDSAKILLIDTRSNFAVRILDETRAWNPQQGTMLYWNPQAPATQFFFNDRDRKSGKIFTVLFDISAGEKGKRIREYRFDDTPVGNSGVAQKGGWFCAINYARLARLRPVTGYPGTWDWTEGQLHPKNDGVFKIDLNTGSKQLLVSFKQLADELRASRPDVDRRALFINHTLSNRESDRIFFFVRGDFADTANRINASFVINPDGSGLTPMKQHIGGHPEWDEGHRMIGAVDKRQAVFDVDRQEVVDTIASPEIIPDPEGDIALSPDARWLVNGSSRGDQTSYLFFRRADGFHMRSRGFFRDRWLSGDLRIDPAPCWNRDGTAILFPSVAPDAEKTRQIFMIQLK
jgi:hypothetical protein